jgi:hypothetical protein
MTAFKGLGTYGDAVGVVTPLDHKLAQAAQVTKTTTPLVVRSGLFYSGATTIVSGTAGMSYSVAAYQLVTQRSAGAGVVFGGNDGTLSVATTAAPGSNSRIDVVYHWHREFALDGVNSNPVIGVVQGTAAASPTVPSLSAFPGAIELARVTVNAAATATNGAGVTITQVAPFTTVDGGVVPFRNKTAVDLFSNALTGQEALALDSGISYKWSGSEWLVWEKAKTTWTATLQNFNALGTGGAATGSYSISAGICNWVLDVTFGSGVANPSTSWGFTLPVAIAASLATRNRRIGEGMFRDASVANTSAAGNADLAVIYNTDTGFAGFRQPYSGSAGITDYGYLSAAQSGIPTLASGDYVTARGQFPVA